MVVPYFNSAVVYASLFAFMAIGLTLTYLTTKVPNFAYGSFVTIGLYTAYTMWKISGIGPYYASAVAFLLAGLSSAVMYLVVLRPLARRGSSLVSLMIATFGVDFGFVGIFGIYTDYLTNRYTLNDTKQFFQLQADFNLAGVPGIVYVAPAVLTLVTLLLYILLTRTKFGVAMRASVENPSLAKVLGINVERVYVVSWILAGGLAGIVLGAYVFLEAASGLSLDPLVPGLVSGFGVEAIAYQKAVPLLIMVAALLVMPKGLVSINWKKLLRRERKK